MCCLKCWLAECVLCFCEGLVKQFAVLHAAALATSGQVMLQDGGGMMQRACSDAGGTAAPAGTALDCKQPQAA